MRKECAPDLIPEEAAGPISAARLLHPPRHFGHPRDVLVATDISIEEKRAMLASWASDIFAIESNPVLRLYPGADKAVPYDEIIQALMTLDLEDERIGKHGLSNLVGRYKRSKRVKRSRRLSGPGLRNSQKEATSTAL